MSIKKSLFVFMVILFVLSVKAQKNDSLPTKPPKLFPTWTFFVPGATHFYEHRIGTGLFLTTFEVGGIAAGVIYNENLKKYSKSPYYNYPMYLGLNALGVDKCDFIRKSLLYIKDIRPDFKFDDLNFNQLMLAPFKPKNIFNPITGTFIALALAELYLESRNAEFSIRKVDQFSLLNRYATKKYALPYYGVASLGMSWEAGVGEEYMFRNYVMPIYDYRYGKTKGLILSSSIFGGMHAFNYLFVDKPDYGAMLYQVTFASVMGLLLGKSVQNNDYHIGPAIAAHTWYDFTLMLGSFIINPKNNIFGVDVKIKL